jgi:hypothetical protein
MIEEFKSKQATERINAINGWVQTVPQRYAVEYYSSFVDFTDKLKRQAEIENSEVIIQNASKSVNLVKLAQARAKLTYAAALYRDCKYSLMHRGRLQELNIHNMYREAYEAGRAAKISEITPSS